MEFPAYTKLEHLPGNAAQTLLAEINSALVPAERRLAEFSQEAQRQLDQALSVGRNSAGALDLDVAGLRASADAMEARAIAAREVANATALAARENRDESESARLARVATEALAVEYREAAAAARSHADAAEQVQAVLNRQQSATQAVVAAQRQGTTALGAVTNSARANRVAFVQLGQQMQDVTIQAQMGTNAFTIFAQQVPQAAFALSGLTGAAGSASARIGAFATFLSGPWGAAFFAATAVLGPFIYALFQSGEAADESASAHQSLADKLDLTRNSWEEVTDAVRDYNAQQQIASETTLQAAAAAVLMAKQNYETAISWRERLRATLEVYQAEVRAGPTGPGGQGQIGALAGASFIDQSLGNLDSEIADLQQLRDNTTFDLASAQATIATDATAAIRENFTQQRNALRGLGLDVEELTTRLSDLNRQERAALDLANDRGGSGERAGRASREAERLATFSEQAAERIQRINERFNEQPRLVDQASQATRELDALIAELSERRPVDFRQMIADAQEAQAVIQDALLQPVRDLQQESDRNLEIQNLMLAGRDQEAEVLRIMWGLEQKLGAEAWQHLNTVSDMVDYEREVTEEIERRLAIQKQYLGATQSIRNELESLFAGEGADFRQIARRLQSQVFVEEMFGEALRQIDREVQGGFDDQVDYLERNSRRAQEEMGRLATTISEVTRAIANPGYTPNLPAGIVAPPANDNTATGGSDTIEVTASRANSGTLGGMDPQQYFDLVGRRMAAPIIEALELQIGQRLPAELSGALSGAIGGYLGSGPVGGVLGALKSLFPESGFLGDMFGGAQMGGTVNGLLGALGIGGSNTGASIGGALGSLAPIPGGSIIGSLAGSLLGKAGLGTRQTVGLLTGGLGYGLMHALGIGGSAYGTASFNGSGAFSVAGSGSNRRSGATDLGNSFMDALDSILDQLDATIGDFAVSIGTYKDKFLVSATGADGKLKPGQSGVTVYADAAEAQAAAIMNAIADGALRGLTAAEQRLLQQDKDLEDALQDVLDFRSVFERLKAYKDPVGAALDEINDEFSDLIDLFQRAGASASELAQLEELYGIERARAIQEASDQLTSSLRSLLDDLNMGDNGLSLRERQANALVEYNALKTRVQAGDTTAFDDYAAAAQTALDLTRQIEGSQSGYFTLFDEVRRITQTALNTQDQLTQEAINRDTPFTAADSALITAIDQNGSQQVTQLIAVNDNLAIQNQLLQSLLASQGYLPNNRLTAYAGFTGNW